MGGWGVHILSARRCIFSKGAYSVSAGEVDILSALDDVEPLKVGGVG